MTATNSALQKAVFLLSRRDYSAHQLRRKLSSRFSRQEIEEALERLRETGLLDEEKLALERARVRREQQFWGDLRLRTDLAGIGIDDRICRRVVGIVGLGLSESESLERLTEKWIGKHGTPDSRRELKRLFDHCLRRGYPPDLVRSKLEIWWSHVRED